MAPVITLTILLPVIVVITESEVAMVMTSLMAIPVLILFSVVQEMILT